MFLVSIEGVDGAGKTTQAELLRANVAAAGAEVKLRSFPAYDSFIGREIEHMLRNSASGLDARSAALWFAVDRRQALRHDPLAADVEICNRYTLSNAVYQSARAPDGEREALFGWILALELQELALPAPDLTFVLDVTPALVAERTRARAERAGQEPTSTSASPACRSASARATWRRPGATRRSSSCRATSARRRRSPPTCWPSCGARCRERRAPCGRAAPAARLPRPSLLRARRPGHRRRRVRHAARRAARDRGGAPRAGHARLADPARRRHAGRAAGEGRAPAADALARQRALGAGAARLGRPHAQSPRARGDRGPELRVRRRAEDRRAGDLAALPRRRARARGDARRRRGRRGRHAQPAHDPRRSRSASRTRRRCWRCAARSTCRCRTSRRSTSGARRRG